MLKVYQMSFFSMGSRARTRSPSCVIRHQLSGSVIGHPFTMGGSIPRKNSQADQQAHPDDVAKQTNHIHCGQLGNAFLPQFAKVGQTPMVKKVMTKKMPRKILACPIDALIFGSSVGSHSTQGEHQQEGSNVTQNELRESVARSPRC